MGGKIRGIGIPIAMWLLGFFKDVGGTCIQELFRTQFILTHYIYIYMCVLMMICILYIYTDYSWV
jgi:hypothetical protein